MDELLCGGGSEKMAKDLKDDDGSLDDNDLKDDDWGNYEGSEATLLPNAEAFIYDARQSGYNQDLDETTDSRDFLPNGPCDEHQADGWDGTGWLQKKVADGGASLNEYVLRLTGGGGGGRGEYAHVDGDFPVASRVALIQIARRKVPGNQDRDATLSEQSQGRRRRGPR